MIEKFPRPAKKVQTYAFARIHRAKFSVIGDTKYFLVLLKSENIIQKQIIKGTSSWSDFKTMLQHLVIYNQNYFAI
jgi:hypothetical protein